MASDFFRYRPTVTIESKMHLSVALLGAAIVIFVLRDVFDSMLVPGRVKRRLRLVPIYFHSGWWLWSGIGRRIRDEERREGFLRVFGPLAMLCLFASWAAVLLLGFALVQLGLIPGQWPTDFFESLYSTGVRIFTAGTGAWAKNSPVSKVLDVLEAGTGLGLITIVITYLPVLYQLFSRRETHVILLDERAGSPVTAMSLLCNHSSRNANAHLEQLLSGWEKWGAELLDSHVSYPMLSYYRSAYSDQSWLTAVAVVMDTCSLRIAGVAEFDEFQAETTLSMCISALHNIADILRVHPLDTYTDRLKKEEFQFLRQTLNRAAIPGGDDQAWERLTEVRKRYEPLLAAMAKYLIITLPAWITEGKPKSALDAATM